MLDDMLYKYRGKVAAIHDWTDLTVNIDLGFNVWTVQRVVLEGVGMHIKPVDEVRQFIHRTVMKRRCWLDVRRPVHKGKQYTVVTLYYIDKKKDDEKPICLNTLLVDMGYVEPLR